MDCMAVIWINKKPSCRYGEPTVPLISEGQRPTSGCKKTTVPCWRYGDAAIANATISAKIRYGNSAHVDDGNFAFKIAAKPL